MHDSLVLSQVARCTSGCPFGEIHEPNEGTLQKQTLLFVVETPAFVIPLIRLVNVTNISTCA